METCVPTGDTGSRMLTSQSCPGTNLAKAVLAQGQPTPVAGHCIVQGSLGSMGPTLPSVQLCLLRPHSY